MRDRFKAAAIAAAAALGIASTAAFAQPATGQAQPGRQMSQPMMQQGQGMTNGMMGMTHDPRMREQMMQMMSACQKMMGEMQTDRSGAARS